MRTVLCNHQSTKWSEKKAALGHEFWNCWRELLPFLVALCSGLAVASGMVALRYEGQNVHLEPPW